MFPSIISHILSGILLFVSLLSIVFYFKKFQTFDPYQMLVLLLLFSGALGIHGISHLGLEKAYNYNPIHTIYQ